MYEDEPRDPLPSYEEVFGGDNERDEEECRKVFEEDTGYADIEECYEIEECDECLNSSYKGYRFCPKCGKPVIRTVSVAPEGKHKDQGLVNAVRVIGLILMLGCVAMLFFEICMVFWGMEEILDNIGRYSLGILFLVPMPAVLFWVSGIFAYGYYLFLVVATIVSFILLLYNSREGIMAMLRDKKVEAADDIPLYSVATLFAATIAINLIFNLLVTAAGSTPAVPEPLDELWMEWYSLLNASVWEEVICRVIYIGIPMMVVALCLKESGAWKRLFGHFEMNNAAVAFIIISAVIFAVAHVSSWDVFKIFPTFVSGLALGYLFVKYGVYASIMFHFLIDYLSSVEWVLGVGDRATMLLGSFLMFVVMLGVVFAVWYAVRAVKFVKERI